MINSLICAVSKFSTVGAPLLLLAGPALPQWQTAETLNIANWKTCQIETPAYTGSCRTTVFTLREGSLNIHFDVDTTGRRGLTWGISAIPPEGSNVFPVVLTAERFGKRTVRYSSGECRVAAQEIYCVTHDGQQTAVVRDRLPD